MGDLRPRNIFLNNLEKVKVGNRFSWPHETTNYSKAIFDKEVTYLGNSKDIQLLNKLKNSASDTINLRLTSKRQRVSQLG